MADSVTWRNIKSVEDTRAISDFRSLVSIALQSQYSHSAKYQALGDLFREEIDASPELDNFYTHGLNPETATGFWLDWWGKRVGVARTLYVDGVETRLDDDLFRFLIFYRAVANISGSTAETINRLLTKLLGYTCFSFDNQDMTITVRIIADLSGVEYEILKNYGLLNRPGGVKCKILVVPPDTSVFGFNGSLLNPFNQGMFATPATVIDI